MITVLVNVNDAIAVNFPCKSKHAPNKFGMGHCGATIPARLFGRVEDLGKSYIIFQTIIIFIRYI